MVLINYTVHLVYGMEMTTVIYNKSFFLEIIFNFLLTRYFYFLSIFVIVKM